ncbi:MAG: acylneuraminate cytidylyltransferase family protein [Alphaproteobacteria bacterium]
MTEVLAIVPARGGSKGLPRKNVAPFMERPLIEWSIEAAVASRSVTRIVVSTDDEEIAATGRRAGADTPFLRPAELARDETLDLPVFVHALEWLAEHESYRPDLVVHLRPTSPLRPPGLIDKGVATIAADPRADSLRAVCLPANNPFKMWLMDDDSPYMHGLVPTDIPEPYNQPRQALPVAYWQIGVLDVIRPATILNGNSMTGERILPLIVDSALAVDIDDAASLARAEEACQQFERTNAVRAGAACK